MKKIVAAGIAVIAALVLVGSGQWPFPDSSQTYSGTPLSITIGEKPYEANALFYIAEDQGFFARNGLNVTTLIYNSVPEALNGMLNDEVDMGLASEYAIVGKLFNKENIYIIGNIDRFQSLFLIGRKDKGIEDISDLKGKKIGLTRDAIGEFYLGRFLDLHSMSVQDVTLVNTPPPHQVQALTNGSVDALVTSSNNIEIIKERLGSNVVLWSVQNSQAGYLTMSCRSDWAASHPDQINRLLKSLVQAEEYVIDHPDQARAIVQKRLNSFR